MSSLFVENDGPQPPQILKTPVEVYANLRLLQENRTPLLIHFSGRNGRYQTYVVEISQEKGWIALDELVPNDGERLLLAGEPFSVEGFHEGVRIAWQNALPTHPGELDDARCYWIAVPTEMLYHQRRNAYRAQLSGPAISVTLSGKTIRKPLEGRLLDMSATGCKISMSGQIASGLQTGQVYDLSAALPIGNITTAVELRHLSYDEKLDLTFCGLRFHRLGGLPQRNIERFVYQLQREARRDQVSDRFS